jgi:hypothetical protein
MRRLPRWSSAFFTMFAAHDPYLGFWKFPGWRGIWSDQECAALLRNSALFR